MKFAKHKDFDSFAEALQPAERNICLRLRALIEGHFPELTEKFAYGAPFYSQYARVCFLYPASLPYSGLKEGVSFGFNRGHRLSNRQGLLRYGTRKVVADIVFLSEKEIHEEVLLEILQEAVSLDQEMKKRSL